MKRFAKKFDFLSFVLILALVFVFLFSATLYFFKTPGKRYLFRFESVDKGRSALEYRILPPRSGDERIVLYVDELLLGPRTERSRPLFSPGTKQTLCLPRQGVLYINLSSDLLYKYGNASEIMKGIELLKLNIFKTFPEIKKVEIYIEGKEIFKEN